MKLGINVQIVSGSSPGQVIYTSAWQKRSEGSILDADGDTCVTTLDASESVESLLFGIDIQKKLIMKRGPEEKS